MPANTPAKTTPTQHERDALRTQLKNNAIDDLTWKVLKTSIFPGAKNESIIAAVNYCKARNLDILKKPVHIVPMYVEDSVTGEKGYRDVIMPGIAEARTTASRTNAYAGQDEPIFGEDIDFKGVIAPAYCKITVYKMVQEMRCGWSHIEYFAEAVATKKADGKPNAMWSKRPRGQLAKCAEAGALRKAFPDELGGTITADEMFGREEIDITPIGKPDVEMPESIDDNV